MKAFRDPAILAIAALAVAIIGFGLLGPRPVSAVTTSSLVLYEDTQWGGDTVTFHPVAGNGTRNLGAYTTGLHGGCIGGPGSVKPNWNDCVSSARGTLASGDCVRLLWDNNGQGTIIFSAQWQFNDDTFGWTVLPNNGNDQASSFTFGHINQNSICVWDLS